MAALLVLFVFIGLAVGLALLLKKKDHGAKEPASMLWAAFGFGVVSVLLTALVLAPLLYPDTVDQVLAQVEITPNLLFVAVFAVMVGIIEETTKSVPLAFFFWKKRYFNEYTDGVLYFALSGLAFGLLEDIIYLVQAGAGTGLMRIILLPFFHAATCSIFGFFLARYKVTGRSQFAVTMALL